MQQSDSEGAAQASWHEDYAGGESRIFVADTPPVVVTEASAQAAAMASQALLDKRARPEKWLSKFPYPPGGHVSFVEIEFISDDGLSTDGLYTVSTWTVHSVLEGAPLGASVRIGQELTDQGLPPPACVAAHGFATRREAWAMYNTED